MATLIFSQAKAIRKAAWKEALNTDEEDWKDTYEKAINRHRKEFKEILRISRLLHEDYQETLQVCAENWFFITIRPNEKLINFPDFYNKLRTYLQRLCFLEYHCSLEQKGTSEKSLGQGFHCHIVANTKHRSKAECLRDTISTFKNICAENCIEIDKTREPTKIVNEYLVNYNSKDGHKIITKEWDTLWRTKNNLKDIYTIEDPLPLLLSSPMTEEVRVIEWN